MIRALLFIVTLGIVSASGQVSSVLVSSNSIHLRGDAQSNGRLLEIPAEEILKSKPTPLFLDLVEKGGPFKLVVPRYSEGRDRIYSAFQFIPSDPSIKGGKFLFTTNAGEISASKEAFPTISSKKGLQIQMVPDAIELGVRHAAINVNLAQLFVRKGEIRGEKRKHGTNEIYFNDGYIAGLDSQVRTLTKAGAAVSFIILYYKSDDETLNRIMLHPRYNEASPNRLSAFNTRSHEGVQHYTAALEFLAERYNAPGFPHGRVVNFIIGNEVNSHWHWYNMGRVKVEEFTEDYLLAVRLANIAVRKHSATARVYLSLEHHWNIRYPGGDEMQTFKGRDFLVRFAQLSKEQGDFDWHVAFHPYPENLFKAATWNDTTAVPGEETPRITFKNIEVLEKFLMKPEMLFHGKPRRIILSEQGFHSDGTPEGEKLQAAAYCYAYQKIRKLNLVDSFILHRHVDHRHEGGLNLGLWRRKPASVADPDSPKPIYDVFKAADTKDWEQAFQFALPIIGIKSWDEMVLRN